MDSLRHYDWLEWHRTYDDPGSWLQVRLAVVQRHIRAAFDAQPPGPIRVVSMCAGQGRDLLGVLVDHPRRADVSARLFELDPRNVSLVRASLDVVGHRLAGVEVVQADASSTTAYRDAVPADVLLACGIFGNIVDDDIKTTIASLPSLCASNATVIWTRYPREPELLALIDHWFGQAGFSLLALETGSDGGQFGVGVHRLTVAPSPYEAGVRLFTFLDHPDPTGVRSGGFI